MNREINELQTDWERKVHTLETISEFSRSLNSADTMRKVGDIIMLTCMGHKGIEVTALLLEKEDLPGMFSVEFVRGADDINFEGELIQFSQSMIHGLIKKGYFPVRENSLEENPRAVQILESLNCWMLMPISYQGRLTGVLLCGPRIGGPGNIRMTTGNS